MRTDCNWSFSFQTHITYMSYVHYIIYRWRIFRRPIIAKPENVEVFAKAAIALHNMLRSCESTVYCPSGFVDGEDGGGNIVSGSWREESSSGMLPVSSTSSNRYVYVPTMCLFICITYVFICAVDTQDPLLKTDMFSGTT